MITYSAFVSHWTANRARMPHAVAEDIRRAAMARVAERFSAGRADSALSFDDLVERIESALGAPAQ